MFRRPLQQFISKRCFSNDSCKEKIVSVNSTINTIYILCITNSIGICALLLRQK